MSGIVMCKGIGCSVKNKCYRHYAISSQFEEIYFCESPGHDETCKYFDLVRPSDRLYYANILDMEMECQQQFPPPSTQEQK